MKFSLFTKYIKVEAKPSPQIFCAIRKNTSLAIRRIFIDRLNLMMYIRDKDTAVTDKEYGSSQETTLKYIKIR